MRGDGRSDDNGINLRQGNDFLTRLQRPGRRTPTANLDAPHLVRIGHGDDIEGGIVA